MNGVTRACEARLHRRLQVRVKSYASAMMELPRPVLLGTNDADGEHLRPAEPPPSAL
jgi:hypothetical protein